MSSENTPKTPASQPVKRLSVLSPFSAASPQHRRPSKILRDVNEKTNQDQEKGTYPIFQPYEADPNIEMTLCEQSTMVEPSTEENLSAVNQLELSTHTLTGDDTPTVSDLTEQRTPDEEIEPDTDAGTSGQSIPEVGSLDSLKIENVETAGVEASLAEEQTATISAASEYSAVDGAVSSESTSEIFSAIETGLSLADELDSLEHFNQSPVESEESHDAEPSRNLSISEDLSKETTTDEMTDAGQHEISEKPVTEAAEVGTEKFEENATEVADGLEEECNQSTLEDIITTIMNESVASMDGGEEEQESSLDITSTDVHYSAIGELCPIMEESPSQPLSNRQLRHVSDTSLLNKTTSLSDSLAEFMSLEQKFECEGDDGLAETYQKMAKNAQAMAQELEDKLAKMEKALELTQKERDDYQYLHETEVQKNKKETSSLKQRCHELENELETVVQKQLSESAISGLEGLGEKLDRMMKESEMLSETKDRLEKELRAANDRIEELAKAHEESLEQKATLEDELQLRDDLLVQAQAEVEHLSAEKEAKDKEMEETMNKATSEMTAQVDDYKRQLEELQTAGEERQKKTLIEKEDQEKLVKELQSEVKMREDAITSGQTEIERLTAACKAAEGAKEELEKMVNWLRENGSDGQRQEKEQLDANLAQSKELIAKMEAELVSLKDELSEAVHHKDVDITAVRTQLEESENRKASLEAEIESYKSQLEEARSTLATVQNEKDEALHRCGLRSSEVDVLQKQLEDMEMELTKKYKAEKELELMVEKLTEEKKQLEGEKDSGEVESYKKQFEEVQDLLVKLNQEKRDLSGHVEELQEELRAKEERLGQARNEVDRLQTSLNEAEGRKEELIQLAGDLNTKMIRLEEENTTIGMYKLELEEAKRQEILREQKCRELEGELENLRQKQLLEGQLEEMKKLMMEGFDRFGDRLANNKEEPKETTTETYKVELEEAREEIEKHLKTISQLEAELEKEKKEAARALKMCDEMDDIEAEYNERIRKLAEEIDRLKAKCGEVENTGGLLQALRPDNVSQLSPGSVHNSINNMTVAPVASPNMTTASVGSPKAPARGGVEKTFLDPMENTRTEMTRSPATNNTCRQQ